MGGFVDAGRLLGPTTRAMDSSKVDRIIQYALAVAADEDNTFERELGPIHLIKYVYLADLEYARAHRGETFTGVAWIFHKFGPFDIGVNDRVAIAANAIHAHGRQLDTQYEKTTLRYAATDDSPDAESIRKELPPEITAWIRQYVHKYKADTASLLHFVYLTPPMLRARPGDALSFADLPKLKRSQDDAGASARTAKEAKRLKERANALRARIAARAEAPKQEGALVKPTIAPRYDDLYFESIAAIDRTEGGIGAAHGRIEFGDDIWHSPSREPDDS